MSTQVKIESKGYSLRANIGYKDGLQTIVSYSAMKDGKEVYRAKNKTTLLKLLP